MLKQKKVVCFFLEHGGRLVFLTRRDRVGTYRGKWATVSGYLEKPPDEQALTELKEEVSLSKQDVRLVRRGEVLKIEDRELGIEWLIYPYLFSLEELGKVKTDWEHSEFKWISLEDIADCDTVPGLSEVLRRVHPV